MFQLIPVAIGIKCHVILGGPRSISSNYSNSYNIFQQFEHYKFTLRSFTLRKNVNQIIECYRVNMEHARETQTMHSESSRQVLRERDHLEELWKFMYGRISRVAVNRNAL
jgi:hypothetical protein